MENLEISQEMRKSGFDLIRMKYENPRLTDVEQASSASWRIRNDGTVRSGQALTRTIHLSP